MVWDLKKVKDKVAGAPCEDVAADPKGIPTQEAEKKSGWLSRAASKVSSAASTLSTKTASLLDFHSGKFSINYRVSKEVLKSGTKKNSCYKSISLTDSTKPQGAFLLRVATAPSLSTSKSNPGLANFKKNTPESPLTMRVLHPALQALRMS
jgi:hypothetical protein